MRFFRACTVTVVLFLSFIWHGDVSAQEKTKLELTLDKVSEMTLANNLDIQIAKYDAYIKRNDIYNAISIFDAILSGSVTYEDDQLKRTSSIGGSKSKSSDYNLGVLKKLNTGTTVEFDYDHSRDWSDSSFATLNPAHDAQASVALKQDIGKNFFGIIDRNDVAITRLEIENSDYSSIDKIEAYLADTQKAYWKFVLNREKVTIYEEMLDRASSLYKIYTQKVKIGLAEEPDLYAAEANVGIRKNQLLVSQNDLQLAENDLLLKLNLESRNTIEIVTSEILTIDRVEQQDFLSSLRLAIDKRRDYQQALNEVKSKKLNLVTKKNSLWPEIDLEGMFAMNGVAKKFADAFQRVGDVDHQEYAFGVSFSYPLENSDAKGKYYSAQLEKAKSIVLLKKKEREIVVEINDGIATVNSQLEQVRNNHAIVQLQEAKLQQEEKRFRLGRSNSDTLIRFHDDLLEAKITFVESLYQFYGKFIDLRVKENSLLDEYGESVL